MKGQVQSAETFPLLFMIIIIIAGIFAYLQAPHFCFAFMK